MKNLLQIYYHDAVIYYRPNRKMNPKAIFEIA